MAVWQDLRFALRALRARPLFTAAAAFTLVLGIGAAAAMFAVVYGVLLAPLPYGRPERLVSVGLEVRAPEHRRLPHPSGTYQVFRSEAARLDGIGAFRTGNANTWTAGASGAEAPERVAATWVTASTIPLLEVAPLLGRAFTADEDRADGPDAVVIGASVWRERFGARRDVVGRTLYVNSVPRTVVGVMPEAFHFPDAATRLWLPAKLDRDATGMGDFAYRVVARLAPGADPAAAERELAAALRRLPERFPRLASGASTAEWLAEARPAPVVTPLRDDVTGGIARTLWLLAAAAALVLLVAGANVTNLLLIRADGRRVELAVREALGGGWRARAPWFAEAAVLCAAAGAAALAAAWAAVRALVAHGPADLPRLAELRVGPTTVAFVVAVAAAAAVVCSVVPAFCGPALRAPSRARPGSPRASLANTLRTGGRGNTAGRPGQHLRTGIAALQVAVALVVVATSALLLRTFDRLHREQPGFDPAHVVTVWTQLPYARYGDSAAVAFYARLAAAARELPGVRAAGLTTRVPLGDGEARQRAFRAPDDGREVSLATVTVDDDYFAAFRIPLVAGRGFTPPSAPTAGAPTDPPRGPEAILSRRAAALLWGDPSGRAALGRRLTAAPDGRSAAGPAYTVVGIADDVRDQDLGTPPAATLYVSYAPPAASADAPGGDKAPHTMALVVRTAGPPAAVVPAVRRAVRALDPEVPVFDVAPMDDVVRASTARLALALTLLGAAAAVTLVLGAVGLYGVLAYAVAVRTREFGVRAALGAGPGALARSVVGRGLAVSAGGVGAGLVLLAAAAPLLRAFLYGVTAADPATLAGAVLALVGTGALASWLPARRAARVPPAEALRAE